jgi:acetyl esterase/lipase
MVLVDHSRPTVRDGVQLAASRTLTTLVWAPDEPGRWPLLVFGHGYMVGPSPYLTLLRAWAAQGYVVAAPEFPLTDEAVAGSNLDESDIEQQPGDMRFVIDSLVTPGGPLAGRIDPGRVGVAGHSDGADTALAASIQPAPTGEPAIRSVIAMSISPLIGVTHTANPPLLVTQGDADTINPISKGVETFDEAAGPKYLGILHGAGHLPPVESGSSWLSGIEATTGAFLRTYLAGTGTPATIIAAGSEPPLITITAG